ncbi:hypothetical protein FDA94_25805 [Herbidospora galbida]|uniref:Uncharacterized protein n=1 Tax=Herbidospora galbida TaxID=2575442 RepID=A0A4U3M8W7_9ACTN|nr:hypothetical protein [Herbidospora galbida]TKK85331.1 hypothetical protein FDA94_25805 [Herbidospora galbida]
MGVEAVQHIGGVVEDHCQAACVTATGIAVAAIIGWGGVVGPFAQHPTGQAVHQHRRGIFAKSDQRGVAQIG